MRALILFHPLNMPPLTLYRTPITHPCPLSTPSHHPIVPLSPLHSTTLTTPPGVTPSPSISPATAVKRLVFGSIRKHKALHTFLVNIIATLRVVLVSYDAGVRISLPWSEFLAHLTDYRNPFLSAQLLPRFLEPKDYVYKPPDSHEAFSGEEDHDPLAVQRGVVDMDGGRSPEWNTTFKFQFKPPQITACKILSTEIAKMKVNDQEDVTHFFSYVFLHPFKKSKVLSLSLLTCFSSSPLIPFLRVFHFLYFHFLSLSRWTTRTSISWSWYERPCLRKKTRKETRSLFGSSPSTTRRQPWIISVG